MVPHNIAPGTSVRIIAAHHPQRGTIVTVSGSTLPGVVVIEYPNAMKERFYAGELALVKEGEEEFGDITGELGPADAEPWSSEEEEDSAQDS